MVVARRGRRQNVGRVPASQEGPVLRFDQCGDLQGYLRRREGARLAYLASLVPAGQVIVELGSFKGKSTCFLASGSKAGAGVKVHCFDLWDLATQRPGGWVTNCDDPQTLELFRFQLTAMRVKSMVVEHQGETAAGGREWAGAPVGLLFIDGDHSEEGCQADLDAWLPHVAPGGWVAFHDYGKPRFPGVTTVVDRWLAATGYEAYRNVGLATVHLPDAPPEPVPAADAPVAKPVEEASLS